VAKTRIAVGQLLQETNSLNPELTRLTDFETYGLAQGDAVMARYGDVGELSGFAAMAEMVEEVEWVGLARAVAWSGGPLTEETGADLVRMMVDSLRQTQVDGVLLSLHGAQACVAEPDVSGHVLSEVRNAVGPEVPVVATLDLHANITRRMARCADVLVGYHTFPHVDHVSCGARAARVLAKLVGTRTRARVTAWKIPMVVNNEGRATDTGTQQTLWREIVAAEARADVLSVGLYMVQPWIDAPELGWTLYQAYLREAPPLDPVRVGRACWETRNHRDTDYVDPEDLVEAAQEFSGGPVAVSEGHDATNSGAPGDSTRVLAALVRRPVGEGGALCFCVDPEAVSACVSTGQGGEVRLAVGGRRDPYSEPVALDAAVMGTGDLRYRLSGHGGHNLPVDMGRYACVRAGDVTVVLTEKTGPGSSPLLYRAAGLEPAEYKIVMAKSPEGFRRDYEPFSAGILYCAAPGCATPFLHTVPFRQVSRPVFPLEDLDDPANATWAGEMVRGAESDRQP